MTEKSIGTFHCLTVHDGSKIEFAAYGSPMKIHYDGEEWQVAWIEWEVVE